MESTITDVLTLADKLGTLVLLLLVIWALGTERVISGAQYRRALERAEKAEAKADRLTELALRGTTLAEHWSALVQERPRHAERTP